MRCAIPNVRVWTIVALLAGCGGAWLSGELVKRQAGIWPAAETGLFAGVCRATAALGGDCATAGAGAGLAIPVPWYGPAVGLTVRRAELPLAFVGLAYFVSVVTWLLIVGPPRAGDGWWGRAPRALAMGGALASIAFVGMMAIGASKLCGICILIHALNLLMVLAIARTAPARVVAVKDHVNPSATRPRLAHVAVAVSLLIVAGLWCHRREQLALATRMHALTPYRDLVVALRADGDFLVREHFAQPVGAAADRDCAVPDRDQPQVVVFTDYACPACRCGGRRLEHLLASAFAGDLCVTVRNFPLCRECNSPEIADLHPGACQAAYAAEAARIVGGEAAFARMQALLFAHRGPFDERTLDTLAVQIGLDADAFRRELFGDRVRRIVANDVAAARALGVDAVPAVFLDGRRVGPLAVDNPVFWRAVAEARRADVGRMLGMRE